MIVPVMAISNLVLTRQIYPEETNGAHTHYREPVPLSPLFTPCFAIVAQNKELQSFLIFNRSMLSSEIKTLTVCANSTIYLWMWRQLKHLDHQWESRDCAISYRSL